MSKTSLLWTLALLLVSSCDVVADLQRQLEGGSKPTALPLAVTAFKALGTGLFGQDLLLRVEGSDPDAAVLATEVEFQDSQGGPVRYFDLDWDGRRESASGRLLFDQTVTGNSTFAATITLDGILRNHPQIDRVLVRLLSADGQASPPAAAEVQRQAIRELGEPCDADLIDSRCELGLGCRGEPASCQPSVPPVLERLAYHADVPVQILIEGTDPDNDLALVELAFFDAAGSVVAVDVDNDGVASETGFDVDATDSCSLGQFFLLLEPLDRFVEQVTEIAAVPVDQAGQRGESLHATLAPPLYRGGGQECDPQGFDRCVPGTTCYPRILDEGHTCTVIQALRSEICEDISLVSLGRGSAEISGVTSGPSLWEPPEGCTHSSARGRPEAVVMLELQEDVASLRLSTAVPATNFDTILYLLPTCFSPESQTLACVDDTPLGAAAELEVQDVNRGRYLVVVDAWGPSGGTFELRVETD